jgi:hypothetical protein
MSDKFAKDVLDLEGPLTNAFTITPSDSTVFSQATRAVYVGGAGDLKVMLTDKTNANNVVTFASVPAGSLLPIRVQRVYSANTTATSVVGLY